MAHKNSSLNTASSSNNLRDEQSVINSMFKENDRNFNKERDSKHQILFSGLQKQMNKKRSRSKLPHKQNQRMLSSANASKKNIRNNSLQRPIRRAESKKKNRKINHSDFETNNTSKQKALTRQHTKTHYDSSRNKELKTRPSKISTKEYPKKLEYYSLLGKHNTKSTK